MNPSNLQSTFLRLKPNALIEELPVDNQFWGQLAAGALGSFHNEYLVSCHPYSADWEQWEKHPNGDELVVLLSGSVHFILEIGDQTQICALDHSCSFVRVPQGTWHTAQVLQPSVLLFITAGEGTQHRPRTQT